jgi:ABC-type multidrug transport system fused ATPase/permease subunit
VAIVGENGSGKTTLVKILCGLYTPSSGQVMVDGRELSDGILQCSALFQDFTRLQLSLRDNLSLGNSARASDDKMLAQTLHTVELGHLEAQLPLGLDTRLGSLFPGSFELSGGQWQRIALARVALKRANLIVLDEPTTAVDPRAEVEIIRSFLKISSKSTTVIVSHRLGIARLVDKILVLSKGKLVEVGSHSELVAAKGEYARMWEAQSQWYVVQESPLKTPESYAGV